MNNIKEDPLYRHGKHYDQQHGYLNDDIHFYIEQAKKFGSPILELACGTGRITIPIAQQGAEIVGLDISEQMLARAKEKAQQQQQLKIRWVHDDVRSFDLNMRIFFPQELDALLRYNGFCIENKFGDFNESPFTSESQNQIIVCKLFDSNG